ncbi:MAG: SIS domain-containing protein [Gammaproteobacteria bacterium]|nr:SIS domain-containing protein [Gammaproteobacteria bacterium]MCH9763209.1 SIS domain-containing protein [Gammaproteobacteria bacterium]
MDLQNINGSTNLYLNKLIATLSNLDSTSIDQAIKLIANTWKQGKQIITLGNGGSAITAQHYITDWNKMIPEATGKPFRGRTLVDNMGLITAYANDISYADVFIEQLKNILEPGDLVIAISGSGNSENVLKAVEYANQNQAHSLAMCGYNGGKLKQCAHHVVHANINDMQISEDVHAMFCHIVMQALCGYLTETQQSQEVSQEAVANAEW